MYNFSLQLGEDYPLSKSITAFESYMFITTPKWIAEHDYLDAQMYISLFKSDAIQNENCTSPDRRKAMEKEANLLMKEYGISPVSNGNKLGCFIGDFVFSDPYPDNQHKFDIYLKNLNTLYTDLEFAILDYTRKNDSFAVMVSHFFQDNRYPHVHVLYQKPPKKRNDLQNFIIDTIS